MSRPPVLRLTLRPVEPGLHRIMVNGLVVGHVFDEWDDRDPQYGRRAARLYAMAGCADQAAGHVRRLRLRDLRIELRRKLEAEGPWWE